MRTSALSIIFILFVTSVYSQWRDNYIELSRNITTETKNITGFDKIDVSEDFEVHIHFSDSSEKVEIQANENLHALIQVKKEGRTLKIDTKSYSTGSWNNKGGAKERLVAIITVTNLTEIRGNEDVTIVLEDAIQAEELTISLDEDSTLEGFLDVQYLVVKLNEDSVLDIAGSAHTMQVKANEDSSIYGYDFVVGQLDIVLNEDSEAKLTVNGDIDLRAREDSSFHYQGKGHFVRKRLTGDSEASHW